MQSPEPPFPGKTKTMRSADPHPWVLDPLNAGVLRVAAPIKLQDRYPVNPIDLMKTPHY
jgi:hypothetical protein